MTDTPELKAKPFTQQAAGNRHDLVAANLFDLLGGRILPWPDDPEKFFSDAAVTAIRAADHSDAAMGIVRVTTGLDEHMRPLVKAIDRVLRQYSIPCVLIPDDGYTKVGPTGDDYTPIGAQVFEALAVALRELS